MVRAVASARPRPSSDSWPLWELMATPSSREASLQVSARSGTAPGWSSSHRRSGRTTARIGSPKALANSRSRWSWAGTAMMAPPP